MYHRLLLTTGLGLLLILVSTAAEPGPTPPAVSDFVAPLQYRLLSLSPDGQYLATVTSHEFADHVGILDLKTMQLTPGISFDDAEPLAMWWKSSTRLILLVRDIRWNVSFRTYDLATRKIDPATKFNRHTGQIVNPLPADPEHVIVSRTSGAQRWPVLHRINVFTGEIAHTEENPEHVHSWFTNRDGEAVAGLGRNDDEWYLISRSKSGAPWKRVSLGDGRRPSFRPVAIHHDQRRLVCWDLGSQDTIGVVLMDPTTGATEPVFHHANVDVRFIYMRDSFDRSRLRLLAYETDRLQRHYFDSADQKLGASIDEALPGMLNIIISTSADESRLLIESSNGEASPRYWLLDRSAGKLMFLGHANAALSRFRFLPATKFAFTSRDGLTVHGRLHRPDGDPRPPAVLFLRPDFTDPSHHEFDRAIQLLVSRGYAVLQVDQRGVSHYGRNFAAAGELALDSGMADDIADGVRHASEQGWIDPERVAILGENRGGLLAVYTLVRNPTLFRAWVNVNTPFQRNAFSAESLSLDESNWRGQFLDLGHKLELRSYARELDPADHLTEISVPSFHYYSSANMVDLEGAKVRRLIGRSGAAHVFATGIPVRKIATTMSAQYRQSYEESLRLHTMILDFLERHLKSGTP